MNTLNDLRQTLAAHSRDESDTFRVDQRLAAVRRRATVVRRRQRTGVMVGAVAVVALAAVAVPQLRSTPVQVPAAARGGAPAEITSLGWTYTWRRNVESTNGKVDIDLPDNQEVPAPRLLMWSTGGSDQHVSIDNPGDSGRAVTFDAADFSDFWQITSGASVRTSKQSLTVAVYEVDPTVPPSGVGEGLTTFRREGAEQSLLSAKWGAPGASSVSLNVSTRGRDMLWLGDAATRTVAGVDVVVAVDGRLATRSPGGTQASFDPAGMGAVGIDAERYGGRDVPVTVSLRTPEGKPVPDGTYPDLQLGVAWYDRTSQGIDVAGTEQPRYREIFGKTWQLDQTAQSAVGAGPATLAIAPGKQVVVDVVSAEPKGDEHVKMTLRQGTKVLGWQTNSASGWSGTVQDVVVTGPTELTLTSIGTPGTKVALATYVRAD